MTEKEKKPYSLIAAYAVFGNLYENRKNLYEVIRCFIAYTIECSPIYCFTLDEIKSKIEVFFGLSIPAPIIKTALKKMDGITCENRCYTVDTNVITHHQNQDDFENAELVSDKIFQGLIKFIEEENNKKLTEEESQSYLSDFTDYLLSKSVSSENLKTISLYILRNRFDRDFTQQLNLIREGIIINTGLRASTPGNDVGLWVNTLTIYLDTELLFSCVGYNGSLYKAVFDDFLKIITEINGKNRKKYKKTIQLKYFEDVKDEIDRYFKIAEDIVVGLNKIKGAATAMRLITDGCKSRLDVLNKKTKFYQILGEKLIGQEIDSDLFDQQDNHQYNILPDDIENYKNEKDEKNFDLEHLSRINILRKGNSQRRFEDIGYIFMSAKKSVYELSKKLRKENDLLIPLTTSLDYVIEKLWFKLNKGFSGDFPKSLDVVVKAQFALSGIISNGLNKLYDKTIQEYNDGEMSEEDAAAIVNRLRDIPFVPEEITNENVEDVLVLFDEDSLARFKEQQAFTNREKEKLLENNKSLEGSLNEQKRKNIELSDELKNTNQQLADILSWKKKIEDDKIRRAEKRRLRWEKFRKIRMFGYAVIYLVFFIYFATFLFSFLKRTFVGFSTAITVVGIIVGLIALIPLLFKLYKFLEKKTKTPNSRCS